MQTLKEEEEKKLLMDVLCAMQPWVVKATRPNIYDQEHTIMNNARYGRTAQRIHGPVSSLQIGHSLTFNGSLYSLVLCLFLWHALVLLCENLASSESQLFRNFKCILRMYNILLDALQSWKWIVSYFDNRLIILFIFQAKRPSICCFQLPECEE